MKMARKAQQAACTAVGMLLPLISAVGQKPETLDNAQVVESQQAESQTGDAWPVVSVAVLNYAAVREVLLGKSEADVQRIFAKARVKVYWRTCLITSKEADCPPDPSLSPLRVALNILPRSMAKRLAGPEDVVAFTPPCMPDDVSCSIYIFYDEIESLVADRRARLEDILAPVIAHEVGHVLLGVNSHSPSGIMRPLWDTVELRQASQGHLTFISWQVEQLQAGLRGRTAKLQSETSTSASAKGP